MQFIKNLTTFFFSNLEILNFLLETYIYIISKTNMRFETNVSLNMAGRLSIRGRECFPSGLTIFFFLSKIFFIHISK